MSAEPWRPKAPVTARRPAAKVRFALSMTLCPASERTMRFCTRLFAATLGATTSPENVPLTAARSPEKVPETAARLPLRIADGASIFSLNSQPFAAVHRIVLSVAPLRVIPPPDADVSVGVATEPSSMFLSSTVSVVEFTVVVVPLMIRSPVTVRF